MPVNKNPRFREDKREHPEQDDKPSTDRDSDEYWTGETAGAAKARSRAEKSGVGDAEGKMGHPNRVTGNPGKKGT